MEKYYIVPDGMPPIICENIKDAAYYLLSADGNRWKIKTDDGLYELFYGRNKLRSCAAGGFVIINLEEMYKKIVASEWAGYQAYTESRYKELFENEPCLTPILKLKFS